MNLEIKSRWVTALRSGEYKQGQGGLHPEEDSFCCLGVLCDLHSKETGTEWKSSNQDCFFPSYMGITNYLPKEVVLWAGLINSSPEVQFFLSTRTLASFNDARQIPKTFEEIASMIEKDDIR